MANLRQTKAAHVLVENQGGPARVHQAHVLIENVGGPVVVKQCFGYMEVRPLRTKVKAAHALVENLGGPLVVQQVFAYVEGVQPPPEPPASVLGVQAFWL